MNAWYENGLYADYCTYVRQYRYVSFPEGGPGSCSQTSEKARPEVAVERESLLDGRIGLCGTGDTVAACSVHGERALCGMSCWERWTHSEDARSVLGKSRIKA